MPAPKERESSLGIEVNFKGLDAVSKDPVHSGAGCPTSDATEEAEGDKNREISSTDPRTAAAHELASKLTCVCVTSESTEETVDDIKRESSSTEPRTATAHNPSLAQNGSSRTVKHCRGRDWLRGLATVIPPDVLCCDSSSTSALGGVAMLDLGDGCNKGGTAY